MLQGLNKSETAAKYGDQVLVWRRSDIAPDPLAEDDPRNPRFDPRYRPVRTGTAAHRIPEETIERIMPYWRCVFPNRLKMADQLLVVAHGYNSLRGLSSI